MYNIGYRGRITLAFRPTCSEAIQMWERSGDDTFSKPCKDNTDRGSVSVCPGSCHLLGDGFICKRHQGLSLYLPVHVVEVASSNLINIFMVSSNIPSVLNSRSFSDSSNSSSSCVTVN
jgi:hypothetical protein